MTTQELLDDISSLLEQIDDVDDALRRVAERVAIEPGIAWVGIAFVEAGTLTLGPSVGAPDDARRTRIPILYQGDTVGELVADGIADAAVLTRVAELIAPFVLIGWDTGGEAWEA